MGSMTITVLIDFGSTFTKVRALDLDNVRLIGSSQAPSTVDSDINVGLRAAYEHLLAETGLRDEDIELKLASSSAAGGLKIAAIGLVPSLTTEAAKRAAFGAGGKVVAVYSNKMSAREGADLLNHRPDLVLLAGGTDGGNGDVLLHNARLLSIMALDCPVLLAGNKVVADEAEAILKATGNSVVVTENVMPELNQLNTDPAHLAIREIFIGQIIHGKGLDKAQAFLDDVIIPTPLAVLKGATLLAEGIQGETGIGEHLVVDIGGATTDVDSLAIGASARGDVVPKGLPTPFAHRTVEGDLGMRYNAMHILEMVGEETLLATVAECRSETVKKIPTVEDLRQRIQNRVEQTDFTPEDEVDHLIDTAIARHAVSLATKRHAGTLEPYHTATGTVYFQQGKDLTDVQCVIGTGGIFKYGKYPKNILSAVAAEALDPLSLRPNSPSYYLDDSYLLFAAGLLAERAPGPALKILKAHIRKLD